LYNSFNIDLGVKAQGQITKPITIEIPTVAQNPSNGMFYNHESMPMVPNIITDISKIPESVRNGFLPLIPNIVSLNASTA